VKWNKKYVSWNWGAVTQYNNGEQTKGGNTPGTRIIQLLLTQCQGTTSYQRVGSPGLSHTKEQWLQLATVS